MAIETILMAILTHPVQALLVGVVLAHGMKHLAPRPFSARRLAGAVRAAA